MHNSGWVQNFLRAVNVKIDSFRTGRLTKSVYDTNLQLHQRRPQILLWLRNLSLGTLLAALTGRASGLGRLGWPDLAGWADSLASLAGLAGFAGLAGLKFAEELALRNFS